MDFREYLGSFEAIGQARRNSAGNVPLVAAGNLATYCGCKELEQNAVPLHETPKGVTIIPDYKSTLIDSATGAYKDGATPMVDVSPDNLAKDHHRDDQIVSGTTVMNPEITHFILGRSLRKAINGTLRAALMKEIPTAFLLANCDPSYLEDAIQFARKANVVCLRGSGGAADVLSEAIMRRQQAYRLGNDDGDPVEYTWREEKEPRRFQLPKGFRQENCVILEAYKDSIERVVDKVISVVSSVDDNESREMGSKMLERSRLIESWKTFALYKYNSGHFNRQASLLQYTIIFIAVITTFASILYTQMDIWLGDGVSAVLGVQFNEKWLERLSALVATLPLLAAFTQSCHSRFSPLAKYAALRSGADRIESEIYCYRARVGIYASHMGENILQKRLDDAEHEATAATAKQEEKPTKQRKNQKEEGMPPPKPKQSRRAAFSEAMERISTDTSRSELKSDALKDPPDGEVAKYISTLVGQSEKRQRAKQGSCPSGTFGQSQRSEQYPLLDDAEAAMMDQSLGSALGTLASEQPLDDGLSLITADDYVTFRLRPLLEKHRAKLLTLTRQHSFFQTLTYLSAGVNAALALMGFKLWVSMVVALASAIGSISDFEMFTARVSALNDAVSTLQQQLFWWGSLSMVEKRWPQNKTVIVMTTESVASADNVWARRVEKPGISPYSADQGDQQKKKNGSKDKESSTKEKQVADSQS
jgi:hypothetical protein